MADENITYSFREKEWFLPLANVSRIMKKSLPTTAKISKEAKEAVQECVSEFISFITDEASDKCQREKRKTINGDDLLWAMTTLGFENYVRPLQVYLNKYREIEGERNSTAIARQGDHDKVDNFISIKGDLQGFNGGFCSMEAQVVPKNFGDKGRVTSSHGKNSKMGSFYMGMRIHENGGFS
ncbi:nuclear transcription factor Y subunit B-3-like [Telopea speciosissima]|uniref:nuclear transcription factor Y subunit B-3-like n=1 Tax=Telopea speciosissima TaxID=54955 RepID=UPI001CC3CD15|nr:nuclear transcription factor Y subunit B-3-like [Telopea speciosissima]